jgi:2-keto-4-pentenoate hydratase/2-oxohepta-3-ene-1,7-dioic acid hydratase in catechol pathway
MRLVTYTLGSSGARLGALVDGLVVDVERLGASRGLAWPSDMLTFIDNSVTLLLALGDCLDATGTPEGVGAGMSPQEWLWPGDVLEAGVDGVGVIRHPVVAI